MSYWISMPPDAMKWQKNSHFSSLHPDGWHHHFSVNHSVLILSIVHFIRTKPLFIRSWNAILYYKIERIWLELIKLNNLTRNIWLEKSDFWKNTPSLIWLQIFIFSKNNKLHPYIIAWINEHKNFRVYLTESNRVSTYLFFIYKWSSMY